MADWNPALYRRFEDERTRPAAELLARVPLVGGSARAIFAVDLGCGPGNSTELLVKRFPQARVVGVDNSASMLASARERLPGAEFVESDIADWSPAPGEAPDLLFANASLQWVPDHAELLPRLFGLLAPGGVLAVQMPDNWQEPSHRLMREVARDPAWAAQIGDAERLRTPLLGIARYYDVLAPLAAEVDVWHTIYQHRMADAGAIVQWLSSTGLRPFVDPLSDAQRAGFLAEYGRRIDAAYPPRADGQRLLAFPRFFLVARKAQDSAP
ncbi:trans-aconitate 2-methyltransferase [Pseudorhodoferax sp. Leaf274]|uniref:trans-aconitate 2-methyltransferase n=1 Tax=Pseudorhodoferax sp. Leaf274 TaxID=1736318 RepID=UPI00070371CA|nr:trans-aconitate 2-methyltransferase [Pseudorhodoferax sp. Leaf274]KQP35776.1 trans-aconitate methyltransferase [Pseudorhodoferax sp. Leaf274]